LKAVKLIDKSGNGSGEIRNAELKMKNGTSSERGKLKFVFAQ
jgi:hypothetical protein